MPRTVDEHSGEVLRKLFHTPTAPAEIRERPSKESRRVFRVLGEDAALRLPMKKCDRKHYSKCLAGSFPAS